jgi:RIO1 family
MLYCIIRTMNMNEIANDFAPLRPVSASNHSHIVECLKDHFAFDRKVTENEADFLLDDNEAPQDFVKNVMTVLKSSSTEGDLQDGIFHAMRKLQNISVPEESRKEPKPKRFEYLRNIFRNIARGDRVAYAEKDTKSLLELYATKYLPEGLVDGRAQQRMKVAEPGLFVKASSRPDVGALISTARDETGVVTDSDISFGEIKNDDGCTARNAIDQEVCYLMLLLYWWKVFCGREVDEVFGFTVCGPKCRDTKGLKRNLFGSVTNARYVICLIKLSAPLTLGGMNVATILEKRCDLGDDDGAKLLFRFLSSKRLWNRIREKRQISHPCAAWMSVPVGFGECIAVERKWSLIENGTAALVFRCEGADGVRSLLTLVEESLMETFERYWYKYLNQCNDRNRIFYVKVKTRATDRNFNQNPRDMVREAQSMEDQEIVKTYPVVPVQHERGYFVLMNDRGSRIDPETMVFDLDDFKAKYRSLWERTIAFSKAARLYHGDIAEHNLLIDTEKNLVLIDWDEAEPYPKSRYTEGNEEGTLRHLEILRPEGTLYTEFQLVLLFYRIKYRYIARQPWDVTQLHELRPLREAFELPASEYQNDCITAAAKCFVDAAKQDLGID